MTPLEKRSSFSLAFIFALRMLGLFLVLPVFSLEASHYQGGNDPLLVGFALGAYGLTQAFLQLPVGIASDKWGRKRIIVLGLLVFALGSFVAATADSVWGLVLGRAVQGAGAVSAAVTALLSDQTRAVVRTKAMALVGISIGLVFAAALVLSPLLTAWVGLSGLFTLTMVLALAGVAVVIGLVPPEQPHGQDSGPLALSEAQQAEAQLPFGTRYRKLLAQPDFLRLSAGVFILHSVQMSMWSAVPALLIAAGLPQASHWHVYLPAVSVSVFFLGFLFSMERRGRTNFVSQLSIGLIGVVQVVFALALAGHWQGSLWGIGLILVAFFCGFNAMEALQPSQISRIATPATRGAAMGTYNTLQSLGLFWGGVMGGLLIKLYGAGGLFAVNSVLVLIWFVLIWLVPSGAKSTKASAAELQR